MGPDYRRSPPPAATGRHTKCEGRDEAVKPRADEGSGSSPGRTARPDAAAGPSDRRRRASAIAVPAIVALLVSGCAFVTGSTPRRASPRAAAHATVDGAPIVVEYGRPYRRGRTIFGGLVPYGRIWRTGADEATVLETAAPLRFGDVTVPAGRYSLWTRPGRRRWLFIINRQSGQWGTDYDRSRDLVRVPVVPTRTRRIINQLTIHIRPRRDGGQLILTWERTRLVVPFALAHRK